MLRSFTAALVLALLGVVASTSAPAHAQVRISVEWEGTRSGGPYVHAEYGTGGAYVVGSYGDPHDRDPYYRDPYRGDRVAWSNRGIEVRRGVRIPPGHLPGPGQCRVWYPNVPPGHQPAPFPCADRYRAPHGGGWGYAPNRRYDAYSVPGYDGARGTIVIGGATPDVRRGAKVKRGGPKVKRKGPKGKRRGSGRGAGGR